MEFSRKDAQRVLELFDQGADHEAKIYVQSFCDVSGRDVLLNVQSLFEQIHSSKLVDNEDLEGRLASAAAFDCQDAVEQLGYIAEEGERVASTNMEIIDKLFNVLDKIKPHAPASEISQIESFLTDLMISQGFQDLQSQVVTKLLSFVQKIETTIAQTVDLSKATLGELGMGPSVTVREKAEAVDEQFDIDDLLAVHQE